MPSPSNHVDNETEIVLCMLYIHFITTVYLCDDDSWGGGVNETTINPTMLLQKSKPKCGWCEKINKQNKIKKSVCWQSSPMCRLWDNPRVIHISFVHVNALKSKKILGHSFMSITVKLIHVREQTQRKQTSKPRHKVSFFYQRRGQIRHYSMYVSSSLSNILNCTMRLKYGWIKCKYRG